MPVEFICGPLEAILLLIALLTIHQTISKQGGPAASSSSPWCGRLLLYLLWMWCVCAFFYIGSSNLVFLLEVIWAKSCINVCAIHHKNLTHLKSTSMKRGIVLFPGVGGCLTSERRAFLSPRGERWEAEMHEYIESGGWCQSQGEKKENSALVGYPS